MSEPDSSMAFPSWVRWLIPFVSSFEHEIDAFRAFVNSFPNHSILLIDTYDTLSGARKAVQVAKEMAARGQHLQGVRIDSGDLAKLAVEVRKIFDEAGLRDVKIIGSGGLDEYDLAEYSNANIPYDSYGVGTKMGVSADTPWSDIAYKLVEYDNRPVLKLSTGKVSLPGKKQIFRICDKQGHLQKDIIALRGENVAGAEPLLKKVMTGRKDHRTSSVLGRDPIRFLVRVCKTSRTDQNDPKLGPLSRRAKLQIARTLRQGRTTSNSLTVVFAGDVKRSSGSRLGRTRTAPPPPPRQSPRRRHSRARCRPCEFGLAVWLRREQRGSMQRKCCHTFRR